MFAKSMPRQQCSGEDGAVRIRLYRAQPIHETFREHPLRVVRQVENFNPLVKRQNIQLMLRSFPENPQFRPNILGQRASIIRKI